MNLDLGNTIWLNVSRRLLSFHKYFFTPFEKMPKEVFEEFKHHSHTHADVTLNSSTTSHANYCKTQRINCGSGRVHDHEYNLDQADSHNHSLTLSFGSANLGSPNWWEHTHPITLVCGGGGARHTHGTTAPNTENADCIACSGNPHLHGKGNIAIANAGASHTHTLTGANTQNANPAGTPENHVHPFSITLDEDVGHVHGYVAGQSVDSTVCHLGYDHTHAWVGTFIDKHVHTASGNSGTGGEPIAPPPARPLINKPLVNPILVNAPCVR